MAEKKSNPRRVTSQRVGAGRVHTPKVQTSTVRVPRIAARLVESESRRDSRVHRAELERKRRGMK